MGRRGSTLTAQLATQEGFDVGKASKTDVAQKKSPTKAWASLKNVTTSQDPQKNPEQNATDSVTREHMQMAARLKMIMPDDPRLKSWDRTVLVTVMWSVCIVPMHATIWLDLGDGDDAEPPSGWIVFAIDWLTVAVLIFDIVISSRTAYYDAEDNFVVEPRRVRERYLRSWFPIDLVGTFPYQLGVVWLPNSEVFKLLALPRLLQVSLIFRRFDVLGEADMYRMMRLISFFLVFAHVVACVWWLTGYIETVAYQTDYTIYGSLGLEDSIPWIITRFAGDPTDLMNFNLSEIGAEQRWTSSYYWSLTTLVKTPWLGPGPVPEKVLASLFVIFGAVSFAAILGNITSLVQSKDRKQLELSSLSNNLVLWTSGRVSFTIQRRLLQYISQTAVVTRGLSSADMLSKVPHHFRGDVLLGMHKDICALSPLLSKCSRSFQTAVLSHMTDEVVLSGDFLTQEGAIGTRFYLLQTGELQAEAPSKSKGARSAKLGQGRIVTKGALVGFQDMSKPPEPYSHAIKALKRSQLLGIARKDLQSVFELYVNTENVPIAIDVIMKDEQAHLRRLQGHTVGDKSDKAEKSSISSLSSKALGSIGENAVRASGQASQADVDAPAEDEPITPADSAPMALEAKVEGAVSSMRRATMWSQGGGMLGGGGDSLLLAVEVGELKAGQERLRWEVDAKVRALDERFDRIEQAMAMALKLLLEHQKPPQPPPPSQPLSPPQGNGPDRRSPSSPGLPVDKPDAPP